MIRNTWNTTETPRLLQDENINVPPSEASRSINTQNAPFRHKEQEHSGKISKAAKKRRDSKQLV